MFADLLAHPGVEERCELRSAFGLMAFASRNPFSVEPFPADELMFCTQPVTVIVLSAAALSAVALAPS